MPVVLSQEVESVLVGAAILGACASGDFTSVQVCSDARAAAVPPLLRLSVLLTEAYNLQKHTQGVIKK